MQSAQESLAELRAAIRYCENAISAAESTIESMDFRQQLAKQQAMNKQESTGREVALEREVSRLKDINKERQAMIDEAKEDRAALIKQVQELESKVQGQYDDIKNLEYDLTAKTAQASAWKKEADELRHKFCEKFEPTTPVIPRDVAIAIFREGIKQGVSDACDALSQETIQIDETEYCGDFEVSFSREIDLGDDLDLDWIRDKVGSYDAESVTNNLRGLLENLNFGCRIHGIDDNE
jgi:seryl-tRNA synthetase